MSDLKKKTIDELIRHGADPNVRDSVGPYSLFSDRVQLYFLNSVLVRLLLRNNFVHTSTSICCEGNFKSQKHFAELRLNLYCAQKLL